MPSNWRRACGRLTVFLVPLARLPLPPASPPPGEALDAGGRGAYVSTPSVYFSLPKDKRAGSHVFDIDTQWEKDPGFVRYDFNEPEAIPKELHHAFDFVLVDPPFITREVWEKYATTVRLLAKEGSAPRVVVAGGASGAAGGEAAAEEGESKTEAKVEASGDDSKAEADAGAETGAGAAEPACRVLVSTIAENEAMMRELLDVEPRAFMPSIPNLVYQYNLYSNYAGRPDEGINKKNPEIPE